MNGIPLIIQLYLTFLCQLFQHFEISMSKNIFSILCQPRLIKWINLNFYYHIPIWYLKIFYEGLDTKKKHGNETLSWFLFWQFFFFFFFEILGVVRFNKFILDSYNQLKQCDLGMKTLYIDLILYYLEPKRC